MSLDQKFKVVSAEEIIAIHERVLRDAPGLKGMADPKKAHAVYARVYYLWRYGMVSDVFQVAAAYLEAAARGHIFADGNKRTALGCMLIFLYRNGISLRPEGNALEEMTVAAAAGHLIMEDVAKQLREMAKSHLAELRGLGECYRPEAE